MTDTPDRTAARGEIGSNVEKRWPGQARLRAASRGLRESWPFLVLAGVFAPLVFVVVSLDRWAGAANSIGFGLVVLALAALCGGLASLASGKRSFLLLPVLAVLLLVFLRSFDVAAVKPALRALSEIRIGMTEARVRAVIDSHFPSNGRFERPWLRMHEGGVLQVIIEPNNGRYDASWLLIHFRDGRCVKAEFLPD